MAQKSRRPREAGLSKLNRSMVNHRHLSFFVCPSCPFCLSFPLRFGEGFDSSPPPPTQYFTSATSYPTIPEHNPTVFLSPLDTSPPNATLSADSPEFPPIPSYPPMASATARYCSCACHQSGPLHGPARSLRQTMPLTARCSVM